MSEQSFRTGPCYIVIADDISDTLASWVNLGKMRGEAMLYIDEGKIVSGRSDQTGSSIDSSSIKRLGSAQRLTFGLLDQQIDNLIKTMPYAVKNTQNSLEGTGFGSGVQTVQPVAIGVIPIEDWDENDVRTMWKSKVAVWLRKMVLRPTGNFMSDLVEGEDVFSGKALEFEAYQVDDGSTESGGMGSVFILDSPIPIMGVNNEAQFSIAVTNAAFRTALNGISITTVQDLANHTAAVDLSTGSLTDITGAEFFAKATSLNFASNNIATIPSFAGFKKLTLLNLSNNSISQADASKLIGELWKMRSALGANSAVINLTGNNGLDTEAINQVAGTSGTKYAGDGLSDAGVTVTYS